MINNGIELMNIDGIFAALSIQGILFLFLTPTMFVIFIICVSRRVKKKVSLKKKKKKSKNKKRSINKREEKRKEASKILNNSKLAMEKLADLTVKPTNIEDYRTLDIKFDENGDVIKNGENK